jgi:4-hydroxybenzoate polyprenyltransferase
MKESKKSYSLLYVDLDGTLLKTDMLWEQISILLRKPLLLIGAIVAILKGKAAFKTYCLHYAGIPNPSILPIHLEVLRIMQQHHDRGGRIVLATASMLEIALEVKRAYPIIDECLGSTSEINLKGKVKANAILDHAMGVNYGYIGNDFADIPVWDNAEDVYYVGNASSITSHLLNTYSSVTVIDPGKSAGLKDYIKQIRLYQWVKNSLVFVPALLAHVMDVEIFSSLLLVFMMFSLLASSVYVLNDILDVQSDRIHPGKQNRPIAAGLIPIPYGIALYGFLLCFSIGFSFFFLPLNVVFVLLVYFFVTTFYSMVGKKIAIFDVMLLAGLYTLRLIAGAQAANVILSEWLMGFSMFFFLSLAFVKRYSELISRSNENEVLPGRGYGAKDAIMLLTAGLSSAIVSVLVLALYINSDAVITLYAYPAYLWFICPAIMTWLLHMWLLAHRGEMHDDPIISMSRMPMTYIVVLIIFLTIWFATL